MSKNAKKAVLRIALEVKQEGSKRWIARWKDLRLSTHGDSEEDAQRQLLRMIQLFFDSCSKRGTLAQVLDNAGILPESGANETIYNIVIESPKQDSHAGPYSAVA